MLQPGMEAERTRAEGRSGVIVPTGIATDSSTSAFFGDLIDSIRIVSLYDFQTGQGFFNRIGHARFKFCILTVMGSGGRSSGPAKFVFFIRQAKSPRSERTILHAVT